MTRRTGNRYEPRLVYELAARVKARGIDLSQAVGPWRPAGRASRPGRIITNEHIQVVVDTSERAAEVAGLLNWCGVHELNPVPELVPRPTEPEERTMEKVRDPVCGAMIEREAADAHASNGRREFYFCSNVCADAFEAGPDRFVDVETHEPPFTLTRHLVAPKFGSAGSGGLEHEPGPERHGR
ncbi:MAG TPA: YHS domain-containing protein [Gemmatimonadales bacterium]|nr:YHS domain-containing protein [Gemmatimonadales bacterium]